MLVYVLEDVLLNPNITGNDFRVYCLLCYFGLQKSTDVVSFSAQYVSHKLSMDRRTVSASIKSLEREKIITKIGTQYKIMMAVSDFDKSARQTENKVTIKVGGRLL